MTCGDAMMPPTDVREASLVANVNNGKCDSLYLLDMVRSDDFSYTIVRACAQTTWIQSVGTYE